MNLFELDQPVTEGLYDQNIFKAVFMAGSPGAGKSTIGKQLFSGTGLKVLNVDNFFHLYQAKGKEGDYKQFHAHTQNQKKNYIEGRLGIIIDGTARRVDRLQEAVRSARELGYDCAMVFVNTDLQTALDRAEERGRVTGRVLDPQMITDYWNAVHNNLGQLQSMFGSKFFLVDNSKTPDLGFVSKKLDAFLRSPPTNPAAIKWIKDQQAQRNRAA